MRVRRLMGFLTYWSKGRSIMRRSHVNRTLPSAQKPSKYHNRITVYQGIRFHSQKEENRYRELTLQERAGEISHLELQPRYDIVVNNQKICFYKADFRYRDTATGKQVIEDVKGVRTKEYKLKKKLVEALYGIEIIEI